MLKKTKLIFDLVCDANYSGYDVSFSTHRNPDAVCIAFWDKGRNTETHRGSNADDYNRIIKVLLEKIWENKNEVTEKEIRN